MRWMGGVLAKVVPSQSDEYIESLTLLKYLRNACHWRLVWCAAIISGNAKHL